MYTYIHTYTNKMFKFTVKFEDFSSLPECEYYTDIYILTNFTKRKMTIFFANGKWMYYMYVTTVFVVCGGVVFCCLFFFLPFLKNIVPIIGVLNRLMLNFGVTLLADVNSLGLKNKICSKNQTPGICDVSFL